MAGRIVSMKNSNDTIGNQTRDLLACSAVPQPTAPTRHFDVPLLKKNCVTTPDFVLLKVSNLVFVVKPRSKTSFSSLSLTTRTTPHCQMLFIQPAFTLIPNIPPRKPLWIAQVLQTSKLPLASLLAILFPRTPACPGTQYSPTLCRVETSFSAF